MKLLTMTCNVKGHEFVVAIAGKQGKLRAIITGFGIAPIHIATDLLCSRRWKLGKR
jgi:hypothetical protein